MKTWLVALLLLGLTAESFAGEQFKLKFRSRALLDAMISGYGKENVQGYYKLEDLRFGFKATYGKYELRADLGFGNEKVTVKDLLFNYHFKNSVLSFGNTFESFSMDMLISTAGLRFHQSAASCMAFTDGRKFGASYNYYTDNCYLSGGVYTNNDINKLGSDEQKNSFVFTTRAVARKKKRPYTMYHVGGSFSYRTRQVNTEAPPSVEMSSKGTTSMFSEKLLHARITDAGQEIKGLVEGIYMSPRLLLQSEYYLERLERTSGEKTYYAHGGYIQGAFLLKGRGFLYDTMYAVPGRPASSQAIELVCRFNYTDLNDAHSGIQGGVEKDLSVGGNFYLNRYIGIKINGSYVWVGKHCNDFYKKNLFLVQMRLQYIF